MSKDELLVQVQRYIKLLSAMKAPPIQYIEDVNYFAGLVKIASAGELADLVSDWGHMRPSDSYSLHYIETGQVA